MVEHRKSLPQAVPSSICKGETGKRMNPPKSSETFSLGKLQELLLGLEKCFRVGSTPEK